MFVLNNLRIKNKKKALMFGEPKKKNKNKFSLETFCWEIIKIMHKRLTYQCHHHNLLKDKPF